MFIDKNTKLDSLDLGEYVLVSTDFSHHNYGISAKNMYQVFDNDNKLFKREMNKNEVEPCGKEPLRIFKEWVSKNKFNLGDNLLDKHRDQPH